MQVHIMLRLWLFQVVNTLMGAFMFWDASRNSQVLSLLALLVRSTNTDELLRRRTTRTGRTGSQMAVRPPNTLATTLLLPISLLLAVMSLVVACIACIACITLLSSVLLVALITLIVALIT